jgi:hypothetical protein
MSELIQHATEIADLTYALRRAIGQDDLKNADELCEQIVKKQRLSQRKSIA